MSTGRYTRDIFALRNRYHEVLGQRAERGYPVYLTDADWNDKTRIHRSDIQQFIKKGFPNSTLGETSWQVSDSANENDFFLLGGDNSDEGAAVAFVGGHRCLLYQDTTYSASDGDGVFDPVRADEIHHRYTSVGINQLVDEAAHYRVNALANLQIWLEGVYYDVVSNTATTLTLADFNPAVLAGTYKFYYIKLTPPAVAADQDVWLDVHLEDWGMAEDPILNHNQGVELRPVEACRRMKLIQWVWVDQRTVGNPDNPPSQVVDYEDLNGSQHYVFRLGVLSRSPGENVIGPGGIADGGHENQLSPQEVIDARTFLGVCDPEVPTTLQERLRRGETFATVGNGTTNFGMYNGPLGLLAALACTNITTIYVKSGSYDFTFAGKVTFPAGKRIVGESRSNTIFAATPAVLGEEKFLVLGAELENLYIGRGADTETDPLVVVRGGSTLRNLIFYDTSPDAELAIFAAEHAIATTVHNCRFTKTTTNSCVRVAINYATSPGVGEGQSLTSSSDVYGGVHFHDCHMVNAGTPDQDPLRPVVSLASGQFTTLTNCRLAGGHRLLDVGGGYLDDASNPGGVYAGKDLAILTNCLLTVTPSAGLSACTPIRVDGGNLIIQSSILDVPEVADVDQLPLTWLDVTYADPPAMGRLEFRNNFVRGARIGLTINTVSSQAECQIVGNTFNPISADLGNYIGISLGSGARTGQLLVEGNFIRASAETAAAIQVSGPCTLRGNVLEGGASTAVVESAAGVLADYTLANGIRLALANGVGAGVIHIEANHIRHWGGCGITCSSDAVGNTLSIVTRANVISDVLRGMNFSGTQGGCILDCVGDLITDTRREGVALNYTGAGFCSHVTLKDTTFLRTGSEFASDVLYPGTYAAFMGDGTLINPSILDAAGPGIYFVREGGDHIVQGGKIRDCGAHFIRADFDKVNAARMVLEGLELTQRSPMLLVGALIYAIYVDRVTISKLVCEALAGTTLLTGVNIPKIKLASVEMRHPTDAPTSVQVLAFSNCGVELSSCQLRGAAREAEILQLAESDCEIDDCRFEGSGEAAMGITNVDAPSRIVRARGTLFEGGERPVAWAGVIEATESSTRRSISVDVAETSLLELTGCKILNGMFALVEFNSEVRIRGCEFTYMGAHLEPQSDSTGARISLYDNRLVEIIPPGVDTYHPVDLSGFWIGPIGHAAMANLGRLEVVGNRIRTSGQSSGFTPDGTDVPKGYAAGLVMRCQGPKWVRGNLFDTANSGAAVMLGNITYQDSSTETPAGPYRLGCQNLLVLADNSYHPAGWTIPFFVGVGDANNLAGAPARWHITNNSVGLPNGPGFYCMEESAGGGGGGEVEVTPMGNVGMTTPDGTINPATLTVFYTPSPAGGVAILIPAAFITLEALNLLKHDTFVLP